MAWKTSNRSSRLPPDWPQRKRAVKARDKGICYICGGPGADSVDHVVAGDDHSLTNLALAHLNTPPFCHRRKSTSEGNAAWAKVRTQGKFPTEAHPGLKAAEQGAERRPGTPR